MTTERDLLLLVAFAVAALALPLLLWFLRRRVVALLAPAEWKIAGKLAAVAVLLLLLLMSRIVQEFPATLFLYGRF